MHNEDDYVCCGCCFEDGYADAIIGESYAPTYKNWDQVNSYRDGFEAGIVEVVERAWRESGKPDLTGLVLLVDAGNYWTIDRQSILLGSVEVPIIRFGGEGSGHRTFFLGYRRPEDLTPAYTNFSDALKNL